MSLNDFYRRRKNPWVGFVLVLLFGPFGFLYHSWKTALGIFFAVGPLWLLFLRGTPFDLVSQPWAHYIAVLILAGFAVLQIKAHNLGIAQQSVSPTDRARIIEAALALLPNEIGRHAVTDYLGKHPELTAKLGTWVGLLKYPDQDLDRLSVATLFCDYGNHLGESGDFSGATGSFAYSMMFLRENPLAWAGMAEVYLAREDRVASRYAKKILDFEPDRSLSDLIKKVYRQPDAMGTLRELKERMGQIVEKCSQHVEWADSYSFMRFIPPFDESS